MWEHLTASTRDFSLRAEEVIREITPRPHLLLRITVLGPRFPHLDSEPFVRIVGTREKAEAFMTEISADEKELRAYFPTDTAVSGSVEFGYASKVVGRIPIRRLKIARLDMKRVESEVHRVTRRSPGAFRHSR